MVDQTSGLLSPWLRKKRLEIALPFVGGRCLDMRCGTGDADSYFHPSFYIGKDVDTESIDLARQKKSSHDFTTIWPLKDVFDTISVLAVIEHVEDPANFLADLKKLLNKDGRIVITTPHPAIRHIHALGGRIGLFSQHAAEDHKTLLDEDQMLSIADCGGLALHCKARFLFGANQLFVFTVSRPSTNIVE